MTSTTWSTFRTQLRNDWLKDSGSTAKFSDAQLLRMVNDALETSWPNLHTKVTDSTTTTSQTAGAATYTNREYSLPSGIPDQAGKNPLYLVEIGPLGGYVIANSNAYSDMYRTLRGAPGGKKAWRVDWSRRKLILASDPPYDVSGVLAYYIRMHYVRPLTAITADSDTIEGPTGMLHGLGLHIRRQALSSQYRGQLSNSERLQNTGQVVKSDLDDWNIFVFRHRMSWPNVIS